MCGSRNVGMSLIYFFLCKVSSAIQLDFFGSCFPIAGFCCFLKIHMSTIKKCLKSNLCKGFLSPNDNSKFAELLSFTVRYFTGTAYL